MQEPLTDISVGDKVEHERFGKGVIEAIEGEAPNTTAMVNFAAGGKKKTPPPVRQTTSYLNRSVISAGYLPVYRKAALRSLSIIAMPIPLSGTGSAMIKSASDSSIAWRMPNRLTAA